MSSIVTKFNTTSLHQFVLQAKLLSLLLFVAITTFAQSANNEYITATVEANPQNNSAENEVFNLSKNKTTLPVKIVHFTASVFDTEVLLDWTTASAELDNYFLVEHSMDGHHFEQLDQITDKKTIKANQHYGYIQEEPFYGENYYRLKQVDSDGDFEYSPIVKAEIRLEEEQFKLFPNPAFTKDVLTLRWANDYMQEDLEVSIVDALGQQVFTQQIKRRSEPLIIIDCVTAKLDAGIYYVQLSNQQEVIAHRRFNLVEEEDSKNAKQH